MSYERATVVSLLRRLSQYGIYVGCGCPGNPDDDNEHCRRTAGCARTDYRAALAALRKRLREPASNDKGRAL